MLTTHHQSGKYLTSNLRCLLLFITLFCYPSAQATLITSTFINEIHYDNTGGDLNEFIEIAGIAGTDLFGWSIYAYNGSNGLVYNSHTFTSSLIFTDQSNSFGFISVAFSGLQNGSPSGDAIALINPFGETVQFISYEGEVTAIDGPSVSQTSINMDVHEPSNTPLGYSLQLKGEGSTLSDFSWQQALQNTRDKLNINQTFVINSTASTFAVSEPKSSTILIIAIVLLLLNFKLQGLHKHG